MVHNSGVVEGIDAAEHSEQQNVRPYIGSYGGILFEGYIGGATRECIGREPCRERCDENRKDCHHRKAHAKHFEREERSTHRGFEDGCYSRRGSAGQHEAHEVGAHAKTSGHIAPDGSSGIGNRAFGSGGATEAERERARHYGGVGKIAGKAVAALGYCHSELRDTVVDFLPENVALIYTGEQDTGHGEDEKHPVGSPGVEVHYQGGGYIRHKAFEQVGGNTCNQPGDQGHGHQQLAVGKTIPQRVQKQLKS